MSWSVTIFIRSSILILAILYVFPATAAPKALEKGIKARHVVDVVPGTVRIVRDPTTDLLYLLNIGGDIFRIGESPIDGAPVLELVIPASDHGLVSSAMGLAIDPSGNFYVVGNERIITDCGTDGETGSCNVARIMRGEPSLVGGPMSWVLLAQTVPYPLALDDDHLFNAIAVSPDEQWIFVNSGARTDHGQEQAGDFETGIRETPITAKIFKLPANGENILLENNAAGLEPYLFAEGFRNNFDLAFSPEGELFGVDNGPSRDMPEELNHIVEGAHYGYPWRMGTENNPQWADVNYEPCIGGEVVGDPLLNQDAYGNVCTLYTNDPDFPDPPDLEFVDPVPNVGPDADSYRDPVDGTLLDASDEGTTLGSFTAHRSPLGLVFDVEGRLGKQFTGGGFMLGFVAGHPEDPNLRGALDDPSQDLVFLDLTVVGETYEVSATRIVEGFMNPIDAEIVGNLIYVLEYGAGGAVWEIQMPKGKSGGRGGGGGSDKPCNPNSPKCG